MRPWKSKAYRGYPAAKKQSKHDVVHLKKPTFEPQLGQPRSPLPSSLPSYEEKITPESRDAPIGDHIKDGPKLARLVQRPRRHPVHGVQQAGHAVQ